jgi:hypothetical protein
MLVGNEKAYFLSYWSVSEYKLQTWDSAKPFNGFPCNSLLQECKYPSAWKSATLGRAPRLQRNHRRIIYYCRVPYST